MGRLIKDGVMSMDYPVVQGGVLVIVLAVVLTNILVDIAYGWIDPRIRYS
jgi:peptide/nickel transport system permease protein